MIDRLNRLKALDWACVIFLASVAGIWCMGGGVSVATMTGGAIAGGIAGPLLSWQGRGG